MNNSLPDITNIIIKWILCFCNERESADTDIILCDNLEDYNIVNIFNPFSEHILKDEAIANLEIRDYDIQNDSLRIFQQNVQPHTNYNISNYNMEVVDEHELAKRRNTKVSNEVDTIGYRCRYRTIQIPLTKFLFMKVVKLKMNSDEKFSDDELYKVIDCLLNLLNDELPFLRIFAQQLIADTKLCDRLCVIGKEQIKKEEGTLPKNVSYHMKQESAIYTIQNSFSIYSMDGFGAAAVFSNDSTVRPHLRANLRCLDCFSKPSYLRMDGRFVIHNHEILAKMYESAAPTFSLNVDVDFSDVFYEMARTFADESYSNERIVEKLS
ncbi:putative LRR containing protein [Trachipleistophora hominis]|uniref:Putative LRR containing protein n=1 Tax=Trachipleistophora hominis TaxID=72359 RepID=L7JTI2_TRAHO|nr:putative LRR containing protein [Trachipleistophora hominis]